MAKGIFKEIIKPALILCIICVFFTGALAFVNGVTEPIIDENERVAHQESLRNVYADAREFSEGIGAEALKAKGYNVSERITNIYDALKDGQLIGHVVEVSTRGYGGEIKMLVGISNSMDITGVVLTSHSETPGLGAKGAEPGFRDQFIGPVPEKEFSIVKTTPRSDNEIQAISGATVTSRAITNGVADAVALVRSMSGGN